MLHALLWTALACLVVVLVGFNMHASGSEALALVFLLTSCWAMLVALVLYARCY